MAGHGEYGLFRIGKVRDLNRSTSYNVIFGTPRPRLGGYDFGMDKYDIYNSTYDIYHSKYDIYHSTYDTYIFAPVSSSQLF